MYNNQQGRRRRRPPKAEAKRRRSSPLKKFFIIFLSVLGLYLVALGIFSLAAYFSPDPDDGALEVFTGIIGGKVPERTGFLIMCTDEEGSRTDTIMLGCYNAVDKGISLISIPRDTLVSVSALNYEKMQQDYPYPDSKTMQINHIHHFAGESLGPKILKEEVETWLDIKIDYYFRVDFDAFHYFVDSIGGVDFDVPINMDYEDPTQDLYIHLTKGMQTLDGDKAEQLVRYRKDNYGGGYPLGDIDRVAMQQQFFKALVAKAADSGTITSNPRAYINTALKYVTTNASLTDMVKYAGELKKLNTGNIATYTLPGQARNRYYYDPQETGKLIYQIFKSPLGEQGEQPADSRGAAIQVLNGGYTNGKAAEVQSLLTGEGYYVKSIDTFEGTKREETLIYTADPALGQDLTVYFENARVENDPQATGDYDIVIIIGTEE